MARLSGAAWAAHTAHDLDLAACFGGRLFGMVALNANLDVIGDQVYRGGC